MAGLVTIYSRAFVGRALFARVAARSAAASSAWFAPTSALAASAHHLTVASSVHRPGAMRVASFSTKKKGGDAHVDAAPAVAAPLDAGDLKTQMAKHVDAAKKELAKLRGATASASMLDHVMVSAYGEVQPLPGLAQVSMKNAQLLTVNPFDASLASAIADAIRDAGLNLNPAVEGNIVRVPVPKASKETRDATIKLVSKIAENAKTRIRHVRQAALDKLKKVEGASSDDTFREMKEVQNITNVATEEIVKLADKKKAELEAA